jgi:hypothetical protein
MPRRPRVLGAGDDASADRSGRIVMAVTETPTWWKHDALPNGLF